MGCGGSRADAIESKYDESWTRDTESTWLTNTDTEIHQAGIINNQNNNNNCGWVNGTGPMKEKNAAFAGKVAGHGSSQRGRQMVNAGTQCGKQPISSSSASTNQRVRPCRDATMGESVDTPTKDVKMPTNTATTAKGTQLASRGGITNNQKGAQ